MSIRFTLCVNNSPKNKIGKSLSDEKNFDCLLKEDTSILDPSLILESDTSLATYNYMYCQDFDRYYFINNIESVGNNLWRINAHVDVLETYATKILANTAVIKRQEKIYNLYLDDPDFHVYNYEKIQTLIFPENNFNKDLQYVLVVNGQQALTSKGGDDNNGNT